MSFKSALLSIVPKIGKNNESSREKWLKETLKRTPKNTRILDAGAGNQRYKKYCSHLKYTSQDFGQYDGKGDNSALQTGEFDYGELDIISDILSIPEPENSFDTIMCIEVLEHLPYPDKALTEFNRLLKPNGTLIITAPFCSLTHFSPYHFSSGFNKYWYEHHLADQNFKNIKMTRNGNFYEYLAQEIHRVGSVSSQYSNSKPNIIELLGIYITLKMLSRLNKKNNDSGELLCFGYHVTATKNKPSRKE